MKKLQLFAPLVLVLALAACGGDDDSSSSAEPGVVLVEDNKFEPKEITVAVGDTVTWKFEGNAAHNVTNDDFASDLVSEGEFEHTFEEAGEFEYRCTLHPAMEGTVTVE